MRRFILAFLLGAAALPACEDNGTTFAFDAGNDTGGGADAPRGDGGGGGDAGGDQGGPATDGAATDGAVSDAATTTPEEKR
jgi:hypothetical protein